MATKISSLTSYSPTIPTDIIPIVDVTLSTTKKATVLAMNYAFVSAASTVATTAANTTPVNVPNLVFTYVANAIYMIWVMGRVNSSAATTGCSLLFDTSTAFTDINTTGFHQLAAAGTMTGFHSIADNTVAGTSSGVPAGPLDVPVVMFCLFRPGANTGTAQLMVASETTAVTELMAGAYMVVERVA